MTKANHITPENIKYVYFLGIGGIGMSAIARFFHAEGKVVSGYDRTPSPLTFELEKLGIEIHYQEDLTKLPSKDELDATLIIYTPAIPAENKELLYVKENGFYLCKRSQVLGILTAGKTCLAVAGTHGKTSVTTMTAHLLKQSAVDCSAFMGGISRNYETNLLLVENDSDIVVAEADEYDRSFLQLFPERAVITSLDPDHLDIYGTFDAMKASFAEFIAQVKDGGTVLYRKGIEVSPNWNANAHFYSYAINEAADYSALNLRVKDGAYHFNLHTPDEVFEDLVLAYPGLMNVENAVAACALALLSGVTGGELRDALAIYHGVVRRFDIRYHDDKTIYIDDYAHHPSELMATIGSVRDLYPDKKITGIFQPHLFTRTRDFVDDFARALDLMDEVILLEIYPAREEPIQGVDAGIIYDKMKLKQKHRCTKAEVLTLLKKMHPELLLTLGAGDIDRLVEPIRKELEQRAND